MLDVAINNTRVRLRPASDHRRSDLVLPLVPDAGIMRQNEIEEGAS